jgi:aminomethyltransferase
VSLTVHDDRALLALQGPSAAAVLQPLVGVDLSKIYFSNFVKTAIKGAPSFLTRTG